MSKHIATQTLLTLAFITLIGCYTALAQPAAAAAIPFEIVSFQVDPATIDGNNDGFITGNEFSPIGTDGTRIQHRVLPGLCEALQAFQHEVGIL